MRRLSDDHSTFEFPDNVVFAFNPLYCTFETSLALTEVGFYVVCNNKSRAIQVRLLNGKAKIYFSRILQLFFDDYKHFRTLNFTISIVNNNDNSRIFSTSLIAIWGLLRLGDRYNAYGLFPFEARPEYERTRIWFTKFPFKVSMFSLNSSPKINCLKDGVSVEYTPYPSLPSGVPSNVDGEWVDEYGNLYRYDASIEKYYKSEVGNGKTYGIFDLDPALIFPNTKSTAQLRIGERGNTNVFDKTFDYTFYQNGLSTHIVTLKVCELTAGYYLRWIDRYGELQYFLFVKGTNTEKNNLASDTISDMEKVGPMCYANHVRSIQVTSKTTYKCCAPSLTKEIYEYVSTIITAPIIDLYLGKSASGREIWLPVSIVATSHNYDNRKLLNDLIISFTVPENSSQIL